MSWWDDYQGPRAVDGGRRVDPRRQRGEGLAGDLLDLVRARSTSGVASRGRSYARAGQTVDVTLGRGRVSARIQGSDEEPYEVSIVTTVSDDVVARFREVVRDAFAHGDGALQDLHDRLDAAGLDRVVAPRFECTCPYGASDRQVCKHVVALAYVVADALDTSLDALGTWWDTDIEALADDAHPAPVAHLDAATLAQRFAAARADKPPSRTAALERAVAVLALREQPSATVTIGTEAG